MKKTTKVLATLLGVILLIISISALVVSVYAYDNAVEVPKQVEYQINKEKYNENKIEEIEFFSLEEGKTRKTLDMYTRGILTEEEAWQELALICSEVDANDKTFYSYKVIDGIEDVETALNSMINELNRQASSLEGDIFYDVY